MAIILKKNTVLHKFYASCIARGLDADIIRGKVVHLHYKYDDWEITISSGMWQLTRHDLILDNIYQKPSVYPQCTPIADVIRELSSISMGYAPSAADRTEPWDEVRQIYYICRRKGIDVEFKHGYVYITTKYESWYFEPSVGKIKLMHLNTKFCRGNSWHIQFRRKMSMTNLGSYIFYHARKRYMPQSRWDEAESLIRRQDKGGVQA